MLLIFEVWLLEQGVLDNAVLGVLNGACTELFDTLSPSQLVEKNMYRIIKKEKVVARSTLLQKYGRRQYLIRVVYYSRHRKSVGRQLNIK